MALDDLPLRDDLRGRTPYGAPQIDVPILLNVNENSHGVPDVVRADIVREIEGVLRGVHRYPDREFDTLREALGGYLGVDADHVWAGNGSNEVLQHVLLAFAGPGRSLLSFGPSYSMYPLQALGTGTRFIDVPRDEDFTLSPETAVRAIERDQPDVVIYCTPNNPTGTPGQWETVEAIVQAAPGVVVIDEAYFEFAHDGARSAIELLPGNERLAVSRTMSKAFAFAGARVGVLAANPSFIDALRLVRLPYHLSALTQAAAVAALRHTDTMLAGVDAIRVQRDRLEVELPKLGYRVWPSDANFVLFGGVDDPDATFRALLARGVLIRNVGLQGTLRVTAGTESETTAFLDALGALGPGGAHVD